MLLKSGLIIVVTHLIIPIIFMIWLWRGKSRSQIDWLIKLLVITLYNVHIFLSGRWDMLSYYLRFAIALLLAIVALKSFLNAKSLPLYPPQKFSNYISLGINSCVVIFFLAILSSYVPQGYTFSRQPVELAFPLQNGTYYIGQGGNSPTLNYHKVNPAQQYALDIVKLNIWGSRALGFPQSLTNYAIFGTTLYSPCNGSISSTVNNLPDLIPPAKFRQSPAGNHILIRCKGAQVLMAHLLGGSVAVQAGDWVKQGQAIAKIGNSGNTTEPHLHIHARKENTGNSLLDGEGLSITFDGRFLVRNSLFVLK
jgi:Peptidase family M23